MTYSISKSWRPRAAASVLAFGLLVESRPTRADTVVAAELDYATPVHSDVGSGAGFGLRLGQQFRLPPIITLTPELAYTYHDFSPLPVAYRGVVGLRLGLGEILRPGVFAHLGIARLNQESPAPSVTDFSYDAGAFLDFTLLPFVNFGGHAAYNAVEVSGGDPRFAWVTLGVHIELVF